MTTCHNKVSQLFVIQCMRMDINYFYIINNIQTLKAQTPTHNLINLKGLNPPIHNLIKPKSMNHLKQAIVQIINSKEQKQSAYNDLLQVIRKNEQQIVKSDLENMQISVLLNFLIGKCNKPSGNQFYRFLSQLIQFVYEVKSQLKLFVYQTIPGLMAKYIQAVQQKFHSIQNCIKLIFNNEYTHFNNTLISRQLLMGKSGQIGNLYKQHFHNTLKTIGQVVHLVQIHKQQQINSSNRISVKSVLLLTIFNNLQLLSEKAIISYLWMVYIYCGGTQQQEQNGVSLYLLEKKNLFSIFKYYMSVQQMSVILLTLYQMSMQRKKNKFELLSAINMIHKKAANQSMFKLSEVAQSIIHLLQDEYAEAFS